MIQIGTTQMYCYATVYDQDCASYSFQQHTLTNAHNNVS